MTGYRYEDRQVMRAQILAASPADFKALAASIAAAAPYSIAGALSSTQKIDALPESMRGGAKITAVM